ncbi:MAG: B12-binding domain-containing protein [Candidatus Methanofastidiosia archaeon]
MNLPEAVVELRETEVTDIVKREIEEGKDPAIIMEELREGMERVGGRFERKEYFITELEMAAGIFEEAVKYVMPKLKNRKISSLGNVVMATVKGDIHDLGKNIVSAMLIGAGFNVVDLGVDVSPTLVLKKAKEINANVVGLSALITTSVPSMEETVKLLKNSGLKCKIMVGGGIISKDETIKKRVGADAVGRDAMGAVLIAKKFVGGG